MRWHHDPGHAPAEDQALTAFVALGNQMALDRSVGIGRPESLAGRHPAGHGHPGPHPRGPGRAPPRVVEALEADKNLIRDF